MFTEAYVLTRFPRMTVNFVHSGWSGGRVTGGFGGPVDLRLDRDVFAYGQTVITIVLAMNDAEYRPYDDDIFNIFANGYRHILDRIKAEAPLARVTLLEPSPYDDFTRLKATTAGTPKPAEGLINHRIGESGNPQSYRAPGRALPACGSTVR